MTLVIIYYNHSSVILLTSFSIFPFTQPLLLSDYKPQPSHQANPTHLFSITLAHLYGG